MHSALMSTMPDADEFPALWGRSSSTTTSSVSKPDGTAWGTYTAIAAGTFTDKSVRSTYAAHTPGTNYQDFVATFGAGDANYTAIRHLQLCSGRGNDSENPTSGDSSVDGYFLFNEPQRKENTHQLVLNVRTVCDRDLSTPAS